MRVASDRSRWKSIGEAYVCWGATGLCDDDDDVLHHHYNFSYHVLAVSTMLPNSFYTILLGWGIIE